MNPYAAVDGIIAKWVKASGSHLFTEWADRPARYFHIPGDPPHECFQIVIFPPLDGGIKVQAAAIDTNDNTELEMLQTWDGPLEDLDALVAKAVAAIDVWKVRQRRPGPK
jgi:hypothetical protein